MQVDIKDIKIPPRFRKELGNIKSLKQSIEELGLLQPIGITRDKTLVFGMRRLIACKELGWEEIDANWIDLDEYLRKIAELEENVRRKKMTWDEEANAIVEIDKAKRRIYGDPILQRKENGQFDHLSKLDKRWNQEKTAEILNISQSQVSEAYTLLDYIEKYPRVANASTRFGALSHIKEIKEKERREEQEKPHYETFVLGDCLEALQALEDRSVRCVVTDPPYGIQYVTGKREQDSDLVRPLQGDTLEEVVELLDKSLSILREKMLKDSAIYLFTNWRAYPFIYQIMDKHFKIRNLLVWVKSNWSSGVIEYQYVPRHELIIYATKGKPTLFDGRHSDILNYNIVKPRDRLHPTQKPVDLLRFLIKRSTVEDELVLDPFAGVGSTAIAAIETKRSWYCIEIDQEYHSKAVFRLKEVFEKCL